MYLCLSEYVFKTELMKKHGSWKQQRTFKMEVVKKWDT